MNITDNGTYIVGYKETDTISLLCSGDFGGATLTIGYLLDQNNLGSFTAIPEATAVQTDIFSTVFTKGINTVSAVTVAGGAGISIDLYANAVE